MRHAVSISNRIERVDNPGHRAQNICAINCWRVRLEFRVRVSKHRKQSRDVSIIGIRDTSFIAVDLSRRSWLVLLMNAALAIVTLSSVPI